MDIFLIFTRGNYVRYYSYWMMVTKSNPYVGSSSRSDRGLENCGSGLCSCPCSCVAVPARHAILLLQLGMVGLSLVLIEQRYRLEEHLDFHMHNHHNYSHAETLKFFFCSEIEKCAFRIIL